jgi:putative addiction module CopG family antidote
MTIEVNLPSALEAFVKGRVADGVYASEAEVIHDAVRRLAGGEFDDIELRWLREAVREGLESPLDGEWNPDEIWADAMTPLESKVNEAA